MSKSDKTEKKDSKVEFKQLKTSTLIVIHAAVIVTAILIAIISGGNKKSGGGMPGMGGMPGGGRPGGAGAAKTADASAGKKGGAEAGAPSGDAAVPGAQEGMPSGGPDAANGEAGAPGESGFPGMDFGGFGNSSSTETSVRTTIAKITNLNDFVTTNGEVETQTAIEVFPSIGGKVVEMKVSLGSPVKAGDVIAYIDPSEPGSYYAKSPVTAPISGSILSSPVKPGQKVSVSSVITKIGDVDNLQVSAKIPERYVADLAIGETAEITLEAYPNVKFIAKVVRISPVVDSATRTKEIILNFDSADSRINAGMFAKVKLYTAVFGGQIAINQDALVNNADKYYLFVVNADNTVSKREVTLGKNVDGYYQILTGIKAGEKVVTEGMLTLYEGAKVKDITK